MPSCYQGRQLLDLWADSKVDIPATTMLCVMEFLRYGYCWLQLNWIWLQLFDSGTLNKSILWSARSTKWWVDNSAESYPFNQLPLFSIQTSQTLPTTEKCWRQVPLGSFQEQISLSVQYKVGHLQEKEQVRSIKSSNKLKLKRWLEQVGKRPQRSGIFKINNCPSSWKQL